MAFVPGDAVILIPSLEPDDRLPAYVKRLLEAGFGHVVVIDDGSGEGYRPVFDSIEAMDHAVVLRHEVNRGKGCGLKTGYRWIMDNLPGISGVITADADGKHTVEDCVKLAEKLEEKQQALYLGSRDFSLPNVPKKSRSGNRITSLVFKLLYGQYLPDTQTGLRAFRREELPFMAEVEGDRYEYEMKVLIACARAGIPMIPVTIETIYENDNSGTHFHPLRDSWRIYKVILGGFVKFMGSSLVCFLVDQLLFNLFRIWPFPQLGVQGGWLISLPNYTARLFSSVLNFALNKQVVFKAKHTPGAFWKYAVTCVVIICLSTLGIKGLHALGMAEWLAKLICDTLLYFLSYRIQANWVFREVRAR